MGDFSLYALRPFGVVKGDPPGRAPRFSPPPPVESEQEDEGLIKIRGGSASFITLNHTYSYNMQKQIVKETMRIYDEVRCKNPDDPEQHVDVKRPTEITTAPEETGVKNGAPNVTTRYAKQPATDTIEVLSEDNTEINPDYQPRPGTEDI